MNKPEPITVPVLRPHTRTPIPPQRRHRDRKSDYQRRPKHRGKEDA